MSSLYIGTKFWDIDEMQTVTVTSPGTQDRNLWIERATAWAKERGMKIHCRGYSTHFDDDKHWHEAHFVITGAENRAMFLLAWA